MVAFAIGKYEDEVLCDVVPMEACHILLGRPWQYDRRVSHDGFTNRYSFVMKKQPITLIPMTPKQVIEDQMKWRKIKKYGNIEVLCTSQISEYFPSLPYIIDVIYIKLNLPITAY